jgi:hypothetical protein
MRKYFLLNARHSDADMKKEEKPSQNVSEASAQDPTYASITKKSLSKSTIVSDDDRIEFGASTQEAEQEDELNFSYAQLDANNNQQLPIKTSSQKQPRQPLHRLTSYIFFKDSNKIYLDGLHHFLSRVTTSGDKSKHAIPENFLRLCTESRAIKEAEKIESNPPALLCPYIKTFGKCNFTPTRIN